MSVNYRFSGIAKGVGVQKIIGRVHVAQIEIEKVFLLTSFSVLEDQSMDMLLGLDMLKRHQCTIDLQHNLLRIGTTGTETTFLPENELPEHSRLTAVGEDEEAAMASASRKDAEDLEAAELQKAIERSRLEQGKTFDDKTISRIKNVCKTGKTAKITLMSLYSKWFGIVRCTD